jgi:hypothetical protein
MFYSLAQLHLLKTNQMPPFRLLDIEPQSRGNCSGVNVADVGVRKSWAATVALLTVRLLARKGKLPLLWHPILLALENRGI